MLDLLEPIDDFSVFPGFSSFHSQNCMFSKRSLTLSIHLKNTVWPYSPPWSVIQRWSGFSISISKVGGLATQHISIRWIWNVSSMRLGAVLWRSDHSGWTLIPGVNRLCVSALTIWPGCAHSASRQLELISSDVWGTRASQSLLFLSWELKQSSKRSKTYICTYKIILYSK